MNTVLHKAETRGHANHGWLESYHTFSFASYYDRERIRFGVLRVLNDDTVGPGGGFDQHPHDNMEIISIPLEGDLEHKDNMGNKQVIQAGEIQVMSAGTGIFHSEYNRNMDRPVKFLQIWIFPREKDVSPRYAQASIREHEKENSTTQILSPGPSEDAVWIHQDAWFSIGNYTEDYQEEYSVKRTGNGVYIFVLEGSIQIGDQVLEKRDGYGIWDTPSLPIKALADSRILFIDIPMQQ